MSQRVMHNLELTRDELGLINNALNEICNGVHIDDIDFTTRLGGSKDEARDLLSRIAQILRNSPVQ